MNSSYWPIHNSSHAPGLGAQLRGFWTSLLAHLDTTTEPRVWHVTDASGETLWNAYDPMTQMTIEYASADELRTWLEELHYRS